MEQEYMGLIKGNMDKLKYYKHPMKEGDHVIM